VKTATKQPEPSLADILIASQVEAAALGSVFLDDAAYYEIVTAGITEEHFGMDSHRRIFRAMQQIAERREVVSIVAVCDELEKAKALRAVGDAAYLSSLVDAVTESDRVGQYVKILKEKYLRRKVLHIAETVQQCVIDPSDSISSIISFAHDDLLTLQGGAEKASYSIKEFSAGVIAKIKEQLYSEQEIVGLPFGIGQLDQDTTGIRETEIVVVGGYPGSGKSSFGCGVARYNAMRRTKVGIFSIEMTKDQLLQRFWAQSSDVPYSHLRNPKNLPVADLARLERDIIPAVDKLPILIDDTAKHIKEIIPRAHLWVKRDHVGLIVLDFLQRVHAPGKSEYDIVSYSIDALTEFAKVTGVPIMVLSQLTRAEDKKKAANTVPTMQQLRSSGRIEQNAHLILFTHRPEDDDGNPNGEDLIVIAKQRAGKKGRIKAQFDGSSQTWGERPGATERMVWRND
jgi:replicative DNA helicase